jgi:transcriptional regulator with XRE-family HTH domain
MACQAAFRDGSETWHDRPVDERTRSFSGRLKAAREQAGLSQGQAGELFGVDQSTYSRWETSSRGVDKVMEIAEGLFRLAALSGLSPSYIATGTASAGEPDHDDPIPGRRAAVAFARACGYDERAIREACEREVRGDPGAERWYDAIRRRHEELFGYVTPPLLSPRDK